MNAINVKSDAEFAIIAPAGFRILWAIQAAADFLDADLTITSGTDGVHSGPDDPHHHGLAYDVRVHDLSDSARIALVNSLAHDLGPSFYVNLEDDGGPDEHVHVQLRRGYDYPFSGPAGPHGL